MEQIDKMPYFNKVTAGVLLNKSGQNLDYWIKTRLASGEILALKKGLYVTKLYLLTSMEKEKYGQYIANILRYPSYISLEYALNVYGVIPEGIFSITSITTKTPRDFDNSLGSFTYRNIKANLFSGFKNLMFGNNRIKFATKAKALFDFLYLKKVNNIEDLRLNLDVFDENDKQEFGDYVDIDNSKKMKNMLKLLKW